MWFYIVNMSVVTNNFPCPPQAGATLDSERRGRLRPLQAKALNLFTMSRVIEIISGLPEELKVVFKNFLQIIWYSFAVFICYPVADYCE